MQHIGDLQPLGQPDFLTGRAPLGRYSARRSRWRFAVGGLEVGFDRASESILAETERPAPKAPRMDFGRKLMILLGMITTTLLTVALAGWAWSSRGGAFGGDTVSAAIVDRGDALPRAGRSAQPIGDPTLIPTPKAVRPRLSAVIEQRKPAPATAPASRATVPIASGLAIATRGAEAKSTATPDESLVSAGNFTAIPSVASALRQAMASGEAQSWSAGDYHGVVVVGSAELRDGKTCRQGTVLLRDGSRQGRTQPFEKCD